LIDPLDGFDESFYFYFFDGEFYDTEEEATDEHSDPMDTQGCCFLQPCERFVFTKEELEAYRKEVAKEEAGKAWDAAVERNEADHRDHDWNETKYPGRQAYINSIR
jgi:hypothetical protein